MANDFKRMWTKEELNQFLQRKLNKTGRFVYSDEDEGDYKAQFINNYARINNASIMRFTDFDGTEKDILGTIVNISQDATIPSRFAFRIDTLGVYIHKLNNEVVFIDRVIVNYEEIVYHYTKLDGTSGYQTTTNLGLYVSVI